MAEHLSADTSVVSRLTKISEDSKAYQGILRDRRLAVSFQVRAELLGANFQGQQRQRVSDLLAATLVLPHAESTDVWYAPTVEKRKELKRAGQPGRDASDADAWVLSSAMGYGLPLLSHDMQQVHLGRACGLRVLTNLPALRDGNPRI